MKALYRQAALRFREAVRRTIQSLGQNPLWARDILPAIRDFKIFDHGRLLDLKLFGFTLQWSESHAHYSHPARQTRREAHPSKREYVTHQPNVREPMGFESTTYMKTKEFWGVARHSKSLKRKQGNP